MTTNMVLGSFTGTCEKLLDRLSSINDDNFNKVFTEGTWTAAQVGEHLLKSYNIVSLLHAEGKAPDRGIDEKVGLIKEIMRDLNKKRTPPTSTYPSGAPWDKEKLIASIKAKLDEFITAIKTKDLSLICEGHVIPQFGEFTKLEWVWFTIFHTQRHILQLDRLIQLMALQVEEPQS